MENMEEEIFPSDSSKNWVSFLMLNSGVEDLKNEFNVCDGKFCIKMGDEFNRSRGHCKKCSWWKSLYLLLGDEKNKDE